MDLNPNLMEMISQLGSLGISGGTAIYTRVEAIRSRKVDDRTANELQGIITEVLDENAKLLRIAHALESELVAQRITDADIKYITDTVLPALKKLADQMGDSMDAASLQNAEDAIEAIETLLSVDMLKVLQLVGFNFKQAIGEPLTLLIQKLITTRFPTDPQIAAETTRLNLQTSLALTNIAQDEEATERLKQVMRVWRGTGESQ